MDCSKVLDQGFPKIYMEWMAYFNKGKECTDLKRQCCYLRNMSKKDYGYLQCGANKIQNTLAVLSGMSYHH